MKKLTPPKALSIVLLLAAGEHSAGTSVDEDREAVEVVRAYVPRLRKQIRDLVNILLEVQTKHLHEPDTDAREYCRDCQRSPYNEPPHAPDCLVPRIEAILSKVIR
jgi:hypothetical protein